MKATSSNFSATYQKHLQTTACLIHLSTFLKYFFPFANFIAPLLIWTFNKDKEFVDEHGRQAVNFQLSIFLYYLLVGILCLTFIFIFATDFISLLESMEHGNIYEANLVNVSGYIILFMTVAFITLGLFILEIYAVINASIHANRGEFYQYPLCIPFIKTRPIKIADHD